MKQDTILNVSVVILAACAVLVTWRVVARADLARSPQQMFSAVEDWKEMVSNGQRMGPVQARVQIVEFADFQCPFCAGTARDLRELRKRYPDDVAVVYRHFPLVDIHPFAQSAAIAAECAAQQGRFEAFHDALFASQDSIGRAPWKWFGSVAAIPNRKRFDECIAMRESLTAVARDVEAGRAAEIRGTPTLVVNGRRLLTNPTLTVLDSIVRSERLAR